MMKRKQRRRWSALLGMLVIFVGFILPAMIPYSPAAHAEAKAQDYTQVNEQSKLSTAHSDARKAANSKSAEENAQANSDSGTSDSGKKLDIDGAILNTIANVVRAGNFGNFGLFYGQVSSSGNDNWNAVRQGVGSNPAEAPDLDAMTNDGMTKYIQFGHAIHQMLLDNSGGVPKGVLGGIAVTSSPEESEVELRSIVTMFTKRAREFVTRVNPLPLFRSFADNSVLSDPAMYTPQTGNFWIILITSDPNVKSFFDMIGGDVVSPMFGIQTNGSFRISLAMMTVFVLAGFTIILGFLGSLVGVGTTSNTGWGQALRRAGVRVMIAVVGLQLFVTFGSELEKIVNGDSTFTATDTSIVSNVVKRHLNLEDWYETGFALPEGVTIPIVDGKMVLTNDTIQAINQFTAERMRNGKSYNELLAEAPSEQAPTTTAGLKLLQGNNAQKAKQRANAARAKVGDATAYAYLRIMNAAQRGSFTPTFTTQLYSNFGGSTDERYTHIIGNDKAGQKWDTGILDTIAKAMSKGEKLSDKTLANVRSSEYLTNAGLQMNATTGGYQLTMRPGYRFGISPIAAYNLMNSQFEGAKVTVPDNVNITKAPNVIYNAASTGVGKPSDNKSAVNTIVLLVLIYTAVISLFKIVGSAVGGVIKGTSAAWGSAAGFGTLIGAAITLFLGTMVLAFTIEITMNLMDELWAIIDTMFRDLSLGALNDVVGEFLKGIEGIPLLGPILKWTLEGVMGSAVGIVITILMLTTMPRILTVPIKVVANYFAGLPDEFGERARIMQEHFTGTRTYRGRDLGAAQEIGEAIKAGQAGAKTFAKGATAVAGAGAAWAGAKLLDKAAEKEKRELEAFKAAQEQANEPEDDKPTDPTDAPESTDVETPEEATNATDATASDVDGDNGDKGTETSDNDGKPSDNPAVDTPTDGVDADFDDYQYDASGTEGNADIEPAMVTPTGDGPIDPDADGMQQASEHAGNESDTAGNAKSSETPVTPVEKADTQGEASQTGETPTGDGAKVDDKPTAERDGDGGNETPVQPDGTKPQTDGVVTDKPIADKPSTGGGDKPTADKPSTDVGTNNASSAGEQTAPRQEVQDGNRTDDTHRAQREKDTAQHVSVDDKQSATDTDKDAPTFKPSLGTRILAGTGHAMRGVSGGRDKGQVAAGVAMMLGSVAGGGEGGKFAYDNLMRGVEQRRQDRMRTGNGDVEVEKRVRKDTTITTEQAVRAQQQVNNLDNGVEPTTSTRWWSKEPEPEVQPQKKRQQRRQTDDHKRNVEERQRTQRMQYDDYDTEYSQADDYNTDEE